MVDKFPQGAQFQPPDGGWGWVVVAANSIGNIAVIPVLQNFGLIYKDRFKDMNMSGTDTAVLININSSFGMLMGLVNGSLLKKFGFRKISVVGALFTTIGCILTAFSNSFDAFLFNYGLLTSLGFGMTMASYSLAVNSYFKNRRGIAIGLATTGMGLGPIFIPLLISYLLGQYGVQGTMLIMGGISMHTFVASSLLQPVKWHMKLVIDPELQAQLVNKEENGDSNVHNSNRGSTKELNKNESVYASKFSINYDGENVSMYGFESPLPRKKVSIASLSDKEKFILRNLKKTTSVEETEEENLNTDLFISSVSLHSNKSKEENISNLKKATSEELEIVKKDLEPIIETIQTKNHNSVYIWFKNFLSFMDINLLKDPRYVNLMLGMSLAICAEMNFSLLTPFILNDYGYKTAETAQVLSCIAIFDIIFRFLAPFVHNRIKFSIKMMYSISLMMLILSRTAIIFTRGYWDLMMVAVVLGIAKGFRTVFMSLLIPSYVPLARLANAAGMQMVANGVIILIGGPLLGVIRDFTGSYNKSILVINAITLSTICMWLIEYLYYSYIKRNRRC